MNQPNILPVSLNGVELYQLAQDFPYFLRGEIEVAREGYIFDGASSPKAIWPLFPRDGTHRAEALKHDWGYDGRGAMECGITLTKEEVDIDFYYGLISMGTMKEWKCDAAYVAVSLFGYKAWNEGDGTRLVLPLGSLAPSFKPRKNRLFRHIYDYNEGCNA